MNIPRARFIFNPRSGHNIRNPWLLEHTRAFISEHKLDATVVPTERPRHATELARRAIDEGCELVVAIGGDGTMNEVATALVSTNATLGLIPCGSGNGLGRHLGLPRPDKAAFRALLDGYSRVIDTGLADGHPFFNAAGLGFDAYLSERFKSLKRRGFSGYVPDALRALFSYSPINYVVHADGHELRTAGFIVAVANSDQYGNNCFIAPGAQVDDGLLDLTIIKRLTAFNALPLAVRLFTGKLTNSPLVTRLRAECFVIEGPAPCLIHTDGEVHTAGSSVEVRIVPASLRIAVPAITPSLDRSPATAERAITTEFGAASLPV